MKNKKEVNEIINEFLKQRPECSVVIGYGSGVIKQDGYKSNSNNQIDILIGVNNVKEWHHENMLTNPMDYSKKGLKYFKLPQKIINFYTGINFLPYLEYENYKIKLGVFDLNKVSNDLTNGCSYYLAGRLSKPNLVLKSTDEFNRVLEKNRKMALWTGACMVGRKGLIKDLYINIAGFSYLGDIRNGVKLFGKELFRKENPKKIANLVNCGYQLYEKLYNDIEAPFINYEDENIKINLDLLMESAKDYLPINLYNYLNEALDEHNYDKVKNLLIKYFSSKNRKSSIVQALKGLITTDISKTKQYLKEKDKKAKAQN